MPVRYWVPVHLGQEFQRDDLGIIGDAHRFGKSRLVGTHLLVGRVIGMSVGIAHLGLNDAIHQFEVMFCAPETSSRKINLLHNIQF